MKANACKPSLLTIGRLYPDSSASVVIFDGRDEVAAVFGKSHDIAQQRAAELTTGANLLRQLRAARVNVTITKGEFKQ